VIDERAVWLATPGKVEGLGKLLKSLKLTGGEGDSPVVVAARQSRQLEQWERTYGMTAEEWLERYGEPREQVQARRRLPEPVGRAPPRPGAPPAYQQRSRQEGAMSSQRGMAAGEFEQAQIRPRSRQEGGRAQGPTTRPRMQQQNGTRDLPQQESRGIAPGRRSGRPDEAQMWGDRPAYGAVLQPDPRSPVYDDAQRPVPERRADGVIRPDEAF
jgi:hypothetical protein